MTSLLQSLEALDASLATLDHDEVDAAHDDFCANLNTAEGEREPLDHIANEASFICDDLREFGETSKGRVEVLRSYITIILREVAV